MSLRARPVFALETHLEKQHIVPRLKQFLKENAEELEGQFTDFHAMISFARSRRHFWSPWLHLDIRENDTGEYDILHGRFSPHPTIWTALLFSWLAIAVLCFFAIMLGVSQQLTGIMPWGYGFVPVGLGIAGLLWLVSQAGQKLAQEEMHRMRILIEQFLKAQHVSPSEDS